MDVRMLALAVIGGWLRRCCRSGLDRKQDPVEHPPGDQRHVKAGEGYFSPDGQTIIYQAEPLDYPFYQIYTQPLAETGGGRPKLLSPGRGRTTCSYFSPDGKRMLFASSHLDPKLDETEAAEQKQQARPTRRPACAAATSGTSIRTPTSSKPTSTARSSAG